MKIYLFLQDHIEKFSLPKDISGSFSFDLVKDEESKLINVEARNDKWFLYSTDDVKVLYNNEALPELELVASHYYFILRNNIKYLIYVSDLSKNNIEMYSYENNLSLTIGNGSCNFNYSCSFLQGPACRVHVSNNNILLEKVSNVPVYINNKTLKDQSAYIENNTSINIYGLRIVFLKKYIIVICPTDLYGISYEETNLRRCSFNNVSEEENIIFKDKKLYDKKDYFLKSPRIRRIHEEKTIKLSQFPNADGEKNLPLILTIGPMFTMGAVSFIMVASTIQKIKLGETTWAKSSTQLVTSGTMLVSMLVWPLITNFYNKHITKKRKEQLYKKYSLYLQEKEKELAFESKLQADILNENLFKSKECQNIILNKTMYFWNKRVDQNDLLEARIGIGNVPLEVKVEYPAEEFSIETHELKKKADELVAKYKYIKNVPMPYSFYENMCTAIMGRKEQKLKFINNIITQFLAYYSYEDLKLVVFTNKTDESYFDYIRYLNHNFDDTKSFRFFATTPETTKNVAEYLSSMARFRAENYKESKTNEQKPYYLIIIDDYDAVKRFSFIKEITENENNIGFSIIILEDSISKLPSKCNNFISLGDKSSDILKNSYGNQEKITFVDEIDDSIDMMALARHISNIPIEFAEGTKELPDLVTFLEMESIGKVEQLNVLNRWNSNDSTSSLRAEVGLDEQGDAIYLDLHEKYHGPHGLIAGMTGSGKSEFIITYILSMAVNYSPDDVSFILIDYKGGGLAYAFEDKSNGRVLPHLAGTITNLDKAEMDRTLVSIDSELSRRQKLFNEAREKLGESTIDIYKYQRFFKEGKLDEAIPHLFIICDEFAELKAQQPDFMDSLISTARIGRSLGVHLILATQKPSGVVNDQIWSNTKFRVCLKVQDAADSKEMLKRPDAASLKQTGRFYLQVGYDEYFILGQSAWAGAKYYPSEKIVKDVDKSINFINDDCEFIKSLQASGNNSNLQVQGEQLSNILNYIISISNQINKKARRLWLDNIAPIISVNDLEEKYHYQSNTSDIEVILGEIDAPERQMQYELKYNYIKDGNTLLYGNDSNETEMMLDTLIYTSCKNYSPDILNFYVIDYGSESFSKYEQLPHVGGMVYVSEDEEFVNLLKMLKEEIDSRKKLLSLYGGNIVNYNKNNEKKLPLKVVIINNYDSLYSEHNEVYDKIPEFVRDSERYGIIFWITGSGVTSIQTKITNSFKNIYAFKLKDISDYAVLYGKRPTSLPGEIVGRGILKDDITHIFQVASVCKDVDNNEFVNEFIDSMKSLYANKAKKIPVLPDNIRFDDVKDYVDKLNNVPIGISKNDLEVVRYDFTNSLGNIISSNKLLYTVNFSSSLIDILSKIKGLLLVVIDVNKMLKVNVSNYYTSNMDKVIDKLIETINGYKNNNQVIPGVIYIQGLSKLISSLSDKNKFATFVDTLKSYEKISIIVSETPNQFKTVNYEQWFTQNFSTSDGIWIGKGLSDQNILHLANIKKDSTLNYPNNMGFQINEGTTTLLKFIDFIKEDNK